MSPPEGGQKVYAIDVGYGQLDWKLRQDARVVVMERTNFRYLTPDQLPVKVPLIVTDVSFISLRLIIPPALDFLTAEGDIIALIKPQFEAGPERVGKNGIVREKEVHEDVLQEMIDFFLDLGLYIKGLDFSPITGASSGNIEFLIHLSNYGVPADKGQLWYQRIPEIVDKAHHSLEGDDFIPVIGIILNNQKEDAYPVLEKLTAYLEKKGVHYYIDESADPDNNAEKVLNYELLKDKADYIIIIGGDGTFLHTARYFFGSGYPSWE